MLQTPDSYQRCHSLRVCSRLCVSNKISHFRRKTSSGDFTPVPAQRAKLPAFFYLFASQDQRGRQPVQSGWLSMRKAKAAVLLAQFALAYTMVIQRITGSNNSELAFASSGGGT